MINSYKVDKLLQGVDWFDWVTPPKFNIDPEKLPKPNRKVVAYLGFNAPLRIQSWLK